MKIAAEGAGRFDSLHGDEDDAPELTASEQAQVSARADELIAARLRDPAQFAELILACSYFASQLHRIMQNLDNACSGDRIGINAVLTACCQIQRSIHVEAEAQWRDECIEIAERELP